MPALRIRDDISSAELRRQARRENDGRVSARLIALANALDGMDRASAARLAGKLTTKLSIKNADYNALLKPSPDALRGELKLRSSLDRAH